MLVSVALATCNGSMYLATQLDSLSRQELRPDELVVSDDASSDCSVKLIEDFARTAPFPVRIVRNQKRLGYRANFLKVAAECRSELIAFCDQDDIWEPRKLALCVAPFAADPEVLLVYHDALAIDDEGRPIAPLCQLPWPPVTEFQSAPPMENALGFSQVFRRSLLSQSELWHLSLDQNVVGGPERMAHDQWFFFLATVLGRIVRLNEQLVRYRQHENNAYGWGAGSRVRRFIWFLQSLRGRVEEYRTLEAAASCRAAILDRIRERTTGAWQTRAALAADKYRHLAHLYASRRWLWEPTDPRERLSAFRNIVADQGYRSKRDWGLGRGAMATDLCLGLPAGPWLAAKRKL